MTLDASLVIGAAAAVVSTASFMPQAWKIIRSRNTEAISAGMYSLTVAGFALWLAYGVLLGQWPLIVPNSLCLILAGFILIMKRLSTARRDALADHLDPDAGGS